MSSEYGGEDDEYEDEDGEDGEDGMTSEESDGEDGEDGDDSKWDSECKVLGVPSDLASRQCMDHTSFLKLYSKYNRDFNKDGAALGLGHDMGMVAFAES